MISTKIALLVLAASHGGKFNGPNSGDSVKLPQVESGRYDGLGVQKYSVARPTTCRSGT
jgi:hypothetical protein